MLQQKSEGLTGIRSGEEDGGASLRIKYLTFKLAGEVYGLEILQIREIIGLPHITQVPLTPDYYSGVINLRGKIIPVMDLRRRFDMPSAAGSFETCIVVVEYPGQQGADLMGLLVDSVSEVRDLAAEDLEEVQSMGAGVKTDFLSGVGKFGEEVILLLDLETVLGVEESAESATGQVPGES